MTAAAVALGMAAAVAATAAAVALGPAAAVSPSEGGLSQQYASPYQPLGHISMQQPPGVS